MLCSVKEIVVQADAGAAAAVTATMVPPMAVTASAASACEWWSCPASSPPDTLISGIATVARGDALLAPSVTRRLITDFARRPPQSAPHALPDLTLRETEVLIQVARGLSNREIASQLFLGEATIKTYVGNILMKLGCRDRVQAVVAAYEAGLVQPGHHG